MGISMAKGIDAKITVEDLEHFLKSDDSETVKLGVILSDEASIRDELLHYVSKGLGKPPHLRPSLDTRDTIFSHFQEIFGVDDDSAIDRLRLGRLDNLTEIQEHIYSAQSFADSDKKFYFDMTASPKIKKWPTNFSNVAGYNVSGPVYSKTEFFQYLSKYGYIKSNRTLDNCDLLLTKSYETRHSKMTKAKKLKIPIITFEDLMKELPCDGCVGGVSNVYKSMHYCSWEFCTGWMKWEDYLDDDMWQLVCNIDRPGGHIGHFCGLCYEEWEEAALRGEF
jgi:hypothetical protein